MNSGRKVESLLEKYESYIKAIISCQTRDTNEANDMFQEVYLAIARAVEKDYFPHTENPSILKSYFYRMIVNDKIDKVRKTEREIRANFNYVEITKSCERTVSPSNKIAREELGEKLDNIIEKLPYRVRMAVEYRYKEGCDSVETATKMRISSRSVSRYVSVGLRQLRKLYGRSYNDNPDL